MTTAGARRTPRDSLGAALLVAVGRALGLLLFVVVVATAARGPLPGLSLAPAPEGPVSDGRAVVIEPVREGDTNASRSSGDVAPPRSSLSTSSARGR